MFSNIYQLREGKSKQFTTFDFETENKVIRINPKKIVTVIDEEGPGIITRLWLTISNWFWPHWSPKEEIDQTILKKLIIRIYWDGNEKPSVEAPLGDFFGNGHSEYLHYTSQFLGMSSGGFYSYFPMPFEKVRIEFENLHETVHADLFLNANYQELDEFPKDTGRFHAVFQTKRLNGEDPMPILSTQGRGHYVGCSLSMQGKDRNYLSFLEAPEYIYIDQEDDSHPSIVGTGGEDYFNGGWYFRDGEFNGPLHGVPLKDNFHSMVTMYRFHDLDAITFKKNIHILFINPWDPKHLRPYWYASTAYWYQEKATGVNSTVQDTEELMSMYRIRDVDHLSIP